MKDTIVIKGARENNLKNISLSIPKYKLVGLTGSSGSCKIVWFPSPCINELNCIYSIEMINNLKRGQELRQGMTAGCVWNCN